MCCSDSPSFFAQASIRSATMLGRILIRVALLSVMSMPCALGQQTAKGDITKVQHIIFLIRENRTFDNMFGTFPGADGATSATISTGQVIPLRHGEDQYPRDPDHSAKSSRVAIDGGKMDAFDLVFNGNRNG